MKKKSPIVTEEFLEERLELTTEMLITEMGKRENKLITEMGKRENKLITEMDKRHDKVMTALDGIVKELEIIREDRELAVYKTRDHEKRITKLEKLQKAA